MLSIGDKFGMLTVIEQVDPDYGKNGAKYNKYKCVCECGKEKITRETYLRNGQVKSCGCLNHASRNGNKIRGNNYIVVNEVVYVELSNTYNIMKCDLDIWEKAKHYTWHEDDHGYASARIDKKTIRFHLKYFSRPKDKITDHYDRDKLNNLKSNIRFVDSVVNNRNVSKQTNNTTGYKGVSFNKNNGKFYSYINIEPKRRKFLGYYDSASEANLARVIGEMLFYN